MVRVVPLMEEVAPVDLTFELEFTFSSSPSSEQAGKKLRVVITNRVARFLNSLIEASFQTSAIGGGGWGLDESYNKAGNNYMDLYTRLMTTDMLWLRDPPYWVRPHLKPIHLLGTVVLANRL